MNIVPASTTIADYCNSVDRGEIVVNRDYQRSDRVWPDAAKSFLIETILLGFPVPKLYLYQVTDLRSRKTIKEVVDGQQRTHTILEFFHGDLRLARALELDDAAGKTYDELDDGLKQRFIDYGLTYDLFVAATEDEVREVFRRINSYTVPLNPEEHRHATFQGEFKWFINRLSREYSQPLISANVFTPKQIVRMADTKLFSEIIHALLYGIATTNKNALDALYREFDKEFANEEAVEERLRQGLDQILAWEDLHDTALVKPYAAYALALAITHVQEPVEALQDDFASPAIENLDEDRALRNLLALAEALEDPDEDHEFVSYVEASASRTNVASQRRTRFEWLCRALVEDLV